MGTLVLIAVIVLVVIVTKRKRKAKAGQQTVRQVTGSFIQIEDDFERIACPSWVVLDVETTGLDPREDRVIEFAARRYIDGLPGAEYQTMINPCRQITPKITELTGIRAKDLMNQPQFSQVTDAIVATIGDLPVVAHNAKFDCEFLVNECARAGIDLNIRYIDTVSMARWAFPGMANYKLNTLIQELGLLDHDQDHRAMSDVTATADLYLLCRERIPGLLRKAAQEQEQERLEDKAFHLNQYGMQAEKEGNVEKAIRYYEDIVSDGACLPNAYIRLAVIYKKQKRWQDVVRVCDSALEVLPGNPGKMCQPEEYQKRRAEALAKIEAS